VTNPKASATPRRRAPARPRSASGRFVKAEPAPKAASKRPPAAREAGAAPSPRDLPETAADRGLELYVLRHADAGDPMAWTGDDADRPLSKKGRRQARRLGDLLRDLRFSTDVILTSPKLRALDTAKLVGKRVRVEPTIEAKLAGGLTAAALGKLVAGLDHTLDRVTVVGHDPELSEFVTWLVGSSIELRKGALARVDLPGHDAGAGRGLLRWLLPPDAVAR
jgi:phosphohistidine phosphatase